MWYEKNIHQSLTILYTNDLHSHFDVMPRISAMVEEQRQQPNTDVLLLDIGDHMDRAFLETEGTMGRVNVDVLNLMRYDVITIGNNEGLTFTPEQLKEVYSHLACPVVCGNIKEKENNHIPDYMQSEVVIHKGNLRIGLIGATVPFTLFYDLMGIEAVDPINTIATSVQRLRSKVDLIIVMSHMGLPFDEKLAESVEGIDVILGGHTHHLLEEPLYINNTVISAAGKFGRHIGRIVFEQPIQGGALKITEAKCIPVVEGLIDEKVKDCIDLHLKQAEITLGKTIAVVPNTLPIHYDKESAFGNLLAQAVCRCTGSQISIVNSGQLLAELPAGEISEMMLHARCPSPINACKMTLLGKDIKHALEQSLLPEYYNKEIYGYGFRGKVLGGICVEGLEIVYNPDRPDYHKILRISVQGAPLQLEQAYTVGTLDMFTFGIGYEGLQAGVNHTFILPQFLRDLLKQELQTPHAVEDSTLKRWFVETDI